MKASTIAEREARGRAAREKSKRSSHRTVGELQRDPLPLLKESSEGRVQNLVPLRYGRMAVSPFTFFRGTAILQAHDLSKVHDTGLVMPICGDGHLMNFGGFATPERQLVFDLNDFDEVSVGPFEWDLKRLAASLVIAARHMRLSRGTAEDLVMTAIGEYRNRMAQYAQCGALDLWYERITFDRMADTALTPERRRAVRRGMEKAASRTHESLFEKMAEHDGHRWVIRDAPPALFHVLGANTLFTEEETEVLKGAHGHKMLDSMWSDYVKTISHDRRELLAHFSVQDIVFKVVGVGSVGTRCMAVLLVDHMGKPLFLQMKEARPSVIARYCKTPPVKHQGERVVQGQRMLQAASDIFLGWTTSPLGRHYYFRQLRDMKLSANIELFDTDLLTGYAQLCGWVMARAHAKASGQAVEVSAYIGRGDQFAEALAAYAASYADQVERDYDAFIKACRSGVLQARSDEDMAADFRV
ncbi:DUF2252 domain-containing protein [bacterium M00.F.Ca.ET.228.01.1.1]|uniref:DUF2252 domain-containing protein n=1 Tax=Burkholderia sp. (strain CCGE1003) TaxID=640512 RepID=E1TEP5_BURSG|nr:DUF2252 domain-containing protein [Paraburkholderia phenoliruptrix]TGP40120.1 DUF2252 domain-containing protein [bacterium M00.F.Ca.ET.228.01.1.1]TGR96095.1 DUF2252 domain-containing protein [bacterium M00.F.Ca.ET.191.01.1.1]TGT97232.1 DUF2252 domain-containing protein [bacterium M00.F.Ca.ET.155.01.1.1]MBW0450726.1 DUF2252 domain-containing protein [Paraburkholderia phenoliruptrix]MBW9101793.1 DUF2252 domain-containing protein [Paraburkholderia phenoliruptrix]